MKSVINIITKAIIASVIAVPTITSCCGESTTIKRPMVLDMVHHNPGESTYQSRYNTPSVISEMGYNGKVYFLFESPMLAINWESVDPDILPQGSADREWVDQKAAEILAMQRECKAAGLTTLAQSDLILFPSRLVEKYDLQERMGDANDPEVERLLRAQITEIFDQFPLIDGLVMRIGETYLHDAPFHKGKINDKSDPQKTIIPLLHILRDEICVKHDKLLIFRTWASFDRDIDRYMAVNDSIEPHDNLIISIKHCEGDFHRANPFSRLIGLGRHPQIIEVQCAREYEGKGAYPNYIANGVIEGFEEHNSMPEEDINSLREFTQTHPDLYAGIWTWTRGGGWGGPYIKDELWCDLNAWVVAQWANDPSQQEVDIFNRYAAERLHLKGDDLAKFRKLALLSADAVVRGKNTVEHDISPWWSRDAGISYPRLSEKINIERVLQQKEEAVRMWEEIVALSEQIEWADQVTKQHVIGSCYYGLRLYEIYQYVFLINAAELDGDWAKVKQEIDNYDLAWAKYQELEEIYPYLATLYDQNYTRHIANNAEQKIATLRSQLHM